jgi:hypothetical protein
VPHQGHGSYTSGGDTRDQGSPKALRREQAIKDHDDLIAKLLDEAEDSDDNSDNDSDDEANHDGNDERNGDGNYRGDDNIEEVPEHEPEQEPVLEVEEDP